MVPKANQKQVDAAVLSFTFGYEDLWIAFGQINADQMSANLSQPGLPPRP